MVLSNILTLFSLQPLHPHTVPSVFLSFDEIPLMGVADKYLVGASYESNVPFGRYKRSRHGAAVYTR